jgi:uncharacterized repeat protein (TIGR01451 family)
MERQLLQSAFLTHNYFLPMKKMLLRIGYRPEGQLVFGLKRPFYANYFTLLFCFGLMSQSLIAQQVTLDKGVDLTSALSGEILTYNLDFGCSSLTTDCIGAQLIDSLPAGVEFVTASNAIIESQSGPMIIVPVYNAANHSVKWDFRTLSEGGLPDGASGTVTLIVRIKAGFILNNAAITNKATIPSSNAGNAADSVTTTVTGTSPKWTVTKQVISGNIYHDRPTQYKISVCSNSPFGNLHLTGATVADPLPAGAVFVSASNGGTLSGNTVTWTLADTLKVTEPCREMIVTVTYPAADITNNNTGLSTSIPKPNTATLNATAIGGTPVTQVGSTNQPLLPPFFELNVNKYASGSGSMQDSTQGRFTIAPNNNSTVPVNNFVVTDVFPDQFDLTEVKLRAFDTLIPLSILVELNHSGSYIAWKTNVNPIVNQSFLVTTIPSWTAGTSFVSGIKFDFGTVPSGFGLTDAGAQKGSFGLIFTPSTPIDNVGGATPFTTPITNTATVSGIRPIDNAPISKVDDATMCIVPKNLAILSPTKSVLPNYVTPVAGDSTAGNGYFKGARVRYNLVLENDGIDPDDDGDGFDPVSNITILNPMGADLLPSEMTYETNSWQIVENTTGLTFDNSGANPVFETLPNFNGTGKTLLRWRFTGDFKVGDYVRIAFNATINTNVTAGTIVTNNFAMSTESEFSCGGADCSQLTTGLNDYFGTLGDPSVLLPNIDQLCVTSVALTVADTTTVPIPVKVITSAGPYAPSDSDPVLLGLSTDTVSYTIGLCNQNLSNLELRNPVLLDLLPTQLTFVPNSVALATNTTGLTFNSTNPVFETIDNFAGTGRTLMRWKFNADFPINKCVDYSFKATIKPGSGGTVTNEPFVTSNDRKFQCAFGEIIDTDDMDGDGNVGEAICKAQNPVIFTIPIIKAMQAKKYVKGAKNPAYLGSDKNGLGIGCTNSADSVLWRLKISNPGNVTLTDAIVVDIFPYIGDVGVQLNTTARNTEWTPYLVAPIVSPKPTIKVWYSQSTNPCRSEISPVSSAGCVSDWSETPPAVLSTVKAVKFTFLDEDIEPAETFWFDIKMLSPDSMSLGRPGIAWNSLARDAVEIPAQEPNKVGIIIPGYDLALRKKIAVGQPALVSNGEDVNFTITVINQSSDTVKSIQITDYIPTGLTLNDPDWTDLGGGKATINLPNLLAQNDSISVNITLKVDATNNVGTNLDNYAEISDFQDEGGNHPHDWDSYPDALPTNDAGGGIGTAADDVTSGNRQGTPNDGIAATDEDDHDGARVTVCPRFTQASAPDQYVCTDNLANLNDIVIPTTATATDQVKFVYFATQQSAPNMYSSGTDLLTVNPVGGTVTLPKASIPTTVGNYWIYSIFVAPPTDPNCRPFDEVFVQINPPVVATSSLDVSVCPTIPTTISASATGGTGTYTYVWDNGLPTGASQTVTPSVTTTYNVTVTDSGGNCVATESVTVTVFPQPIVEAGVDQSACQGQSVTFTASANSGTPTYNYVWSNGANTNTTTFNATTTTTYTVTVTDGNGCLDTDDALLTVFDISAASPTPTICLNQSATINATVNSGTASAYLWSTTETTSSISVTPLTAGTHDFTITVTDVNGCTDVATVTITVNPLPTANAGLDTEVCAGLPTTLTATGGVSYLWSNGVASAATSVAPSVSTTYTVTVTDGNGCMATDDVLVTAHPLPSVNAGTDQNICLSRTATIAAVGTGGTGSLTYTWDNGLPSQTTHTVSPTVSTVYNVTVTDTKGCIFTDNVAVNLLSPLNVSVNSPVVCIGSSATITASVSNGDGNNSYAWDNSLPNQAAHTLTNPVGTTTYNVTVTDGLGCVGSAQTTITVSSFPDFILSKPIACPGTTEDVDITGLINAIAATAQLKINAGSFTTYPSPAKVIGLSVGSHTLTVKNASGCETPKNITVFSVKPNICLPVTVQKY